MDKFLESPWATSHAAYDQSSFNIRPAPEFATAEVIVAATYRSCGFEGYGEAGVPDAGRRLDKASKKKSRGSGTSHISDETWRTILHSALQSPKQPKQSSRRFLQLSPIVPDVALYSGSARLTRNSWPAGELVERMVRMGCASENASQALWGELYQGLSVNGDDDVWARWLQGEFQRRRLDDVKWQATELKVRSSIPHEEKSGLHAPAMQFTRDLSAILRAKPCMTRRQWISLLESVLRIGAVAHVLWLCGVNDRLWRDTIRVLEGGAALSSAELKDSIVTGRNQFLRYGEPALPIIRDLASRYLASRLGMNLLLWQLEALGSPVKSLSSIEELAKLSRVVQQRREDLTPSALLERYHSLMDQQARTLNCRKGIGSNLIEFCRHTLGQRRTADENLRGYDQGYELRKRADYESAPWVVSLGPVALLALVHCCLEEVKGPRSVQRLCEHLAWYGLEVNQDDVAKNDLGRSLRMLGIVLDSPDAESGMLLIPPFESMRAATGGSSE